MDKYESIRSLPFPALAAALRLDMARFTRRKEDWQGYCPVHNSKTNNNCFAYHDSGKFHCFSCGVGGSGAIDLAKLVKNVGFQAAVELLGSVPAPDTKTPPVEAVASADGVLQPYKGKYEKFKVPCQWLSLRGIEPIIAERYGVFQYFNPARKSQYNNRVMIPFRSIEGTLYGYMGRAIEGEPKYLIPAGLPKSRFLFGAYEITTGAFGQTPLKRLYLVESPFCVMKFAMYGLAAVSPFGWSVSDEQIATLKQLARGILYMPDRNKYLDSRGVVADIAAHLWVKAPPLPDGIDDPEYLTKEQVLAL